MVEVPVLEPTAVLDPVELPELAAPELVPIELPPELAAELWPEPCELVVVPPPQPMAQPIASASPIERARGKLRPSQLQGLMRFATLGAVGDAGNRSRSTSAAVSSRRSTALDGSTCATIMVARRLNGGSNALVNSEESPP